MGKRVDSLNAKIIIGLSIFLAFFIGVLYAPNFDFGTIQQGKSFTAEPGENVTATVLFFIDEEYGDRNTHIYLTVSRSPPDWNVSFSPKLHEVTLNVSGIITTFDENLYTEPKPLLQDPLPEPENGYAYIKSPSGKGYLQAKPVNITITVPKSAEYGKTYSITIDAHANWFGETGTIQLTQARNFEYTILVASKTYSEQIVTPTKEENITIVARGDTKNSGNDQSSLYIVIGILFLVIIVMGFGLTKKRSKESAIPEEKADSGYSVVRISLSAYFLIVL